MDPEMESRNETEEYQETEQPSHRKVVIGVGGAGSNFISHMRRENPDTFEYITVETNRRSLNQSGAETQFLIGEELTHGLGTGGKPAIGAQAADEAKYRIADALLGAEMVFIIGGLGGGTGSGAIPIIAYISKCLGIPTHVIVSTPFRFDGEKRQQYAEQSIENMTQLLLDGLIVFPCNSVLSILDRNVPMPKALEKLENIFIAVIKDISTGQKSYLSIPGLQVY